MIKIQHIFICLFLLISVAAKSQELNCKVTVSHPQIQGTNTQIFKTLENSLMEFINERKWTSAQYTTTERIACNFNITVKDYKDDGSFTCELIVQSSRPAYNSNYTSTVFNFKDPNFNFRYLEYDQIELRDNIIDNNLTAVIAYYAYLLIGMDMDTMSPMGGDEILHAAENVVNSAQTLSETGWKAFDDSKNRHGILSDYMDGSMKPFRQMMYDYYRNGLDEMAQNADRGRAAITASLELLKQAKQAKSMSALPQLFTEIKKDELINVYSKGTQKEKEDVFNILSDVNPALNNDWDKIKQPAK